MNFVYQFVERPQRPDSLPRVRTLKKSSSPLFTLNVGRGVIGSRERIPFPRPSRVVGRTKKP